MRARELIAVAALLWLLSTKRRGKGSEGMSPSVAQWESPLLLAGSEVVAPIRFLLSWLRVESGGNNGAVGNPAVHDADGQPWEVGIWQLDPGNRKIAGVTAAELRPNCPTNSGTRAQVEATSRALTPSEQAVQIAAGLKYITWCRGLVDTSLNAVGAFAVDGTRWTKVGPSDDYLRAVKSVHGSPWVMTQGVAAVAKSLGRAPRSWEELASGLRGGAAGKATIASLEAVLHNAEETWPA